MASRKLQGICPFGTSFQPTALIENPWSVITAPFPYCFKDVYNGLKKDRNQVFTRSLHAEENSYLSLWHIVPTDSFNRKSLVGNNSTYLAR